MPKHVVVLGAGVIALEICRQLLSPANKDKYKISVIAREFPGDYAGEYTSPWAGGHWRSHASGSATDERLRRWELETLEFWRSLIKEGRGEEVGIKEYTQYHYWDTNSPIPPDSLWWAPHVANFQTLPLTLNPIHTLNTTTTPQIDQAASCTSLAFDTTRYLLWLYAHLTSHPSTTIHRRTLTPHPSTPLPTLITTITTHPPDLIINATGLGARHISPEPSHPLFPIRGQTVLVKGEANAIHHRIGHDYEAYVIPRPGSGTTILGGTKIKHHWGTAPDGETTGGILRRCAGLAPELLTGGGGFEVVGVQVGLRPAREGGVRVERVGGIVHAYGHAGAGFQMSFGTGREVVRLVEEGLAEGMGAKL